MQDSSRTPAARCEVCDLRCRPLIWACPLCPLQACGVCYRLHDVAAHNLVSPAIQLAQAQRALERMWRQPELETTPGLGASSSR